MEDLILQKAEFSDVLPLWQEELWPGRKSPIKAVSPIGMDLKYDELIKNAIPSFWILQSRGKTVGTISGYRTSPALYRSRGLYLRAEYRGKGWSRKLLAAVCAQAELESCSAVWSLPRKDAWPAYRSFGFEQVSGWFDEGMEFGPNCVARLALPFPERSL